MLHCIKVVLSDVALFDVTVFDVALFRYCTIRCLLLSIERSTISYCTNC